MLAPWAEVTRADASAQAMQRARISEKASVQAMSEEERTPSTLGNYQILRPLGRGGFAQVYLGEHRHLRTQAAIKVLDLRLTTLEYERFRQEAQTIAHLSHPHIVRVLDFALEQNVPYLVMDYAPGGSLRQHYPGGSRLPLDLVVSYVDQVASALAYAHAQQIIHRDIKPDNLLLGAHQCLLLSDFGLALVLEQLSTNAGAQDLVGTTAYMAPEQIQGTPQFASDQYAVGVMVYEWLCGERPFQGSFAQLITQHQQTPPPPLTAHQPELPVAVERVVLRALAKHPEERFPTITAFATALSQAARGSSPTRILRRPHPTSPLSPYSTLLLPQDEASALHSQAARARLVHSTARQTSIPGLPAQANPTSSTLPPHAFPPRTTAAFPHPPLLSRRRLLAGAALLTLLGGTSVAALTTVLHQQELSHHPVSTLQGTPTPARTTPSPQHTTKAAAPPPVKHGSALLTYYGHSTPLTSAAWSPDGTRIASAALQRREVHLWDSRTGKRILLYHGHTQPVTDLAWSPDGATLASGSADGSIHLWDPTTGTNQLVYHNHTQAVSRIRWSPDGTTIASGDRGGQIHLWLPRPPAGIFRYSTVNGGIIRDLAWSPDGTTIASCEGGNLVLLWKAANGAPLLAYGEHTARVETVAWSPSGPLLASGGNDGTVQLWDRTTGSVRSILQSPHLSTFLSVAWSPDGTRVAAGGRPASQVPIWTSEGREQAVYPGHSGPVVRVAWSPDGKLLLSASADTSVRIWKTL